MSSRAGPLDTLKGNEAAGPEERTTLAFRARAGGPAPSRAQRPPAVAGKTSLPAQPHDAIFDTVAEKQLLRRRPCQTSRCSPLRKGLSVGEMHLDFTVTARYYSRGDSGGGRGERLKRVALDTGNTALGCMHVLNYGEPDGPASLADPDAPPYVKQIVRRTQGLIKGHIAPLVEAARGAGLRVMHVLGGIPAAKRYPQYRDIASRFPDPGLAGEKSPTLPCPEWRKRFMDESLGPALGEDVGSNDVASLIGVTDQDWVITTSTQASALLRDHGIWNLLLAGFDTYGCFVTSPGGLLGMEQLGYRCFAVRDCTNTGETAQTAPTAALKTAALQTVELLGWAYSVEGAEIVDALGSARRGAK